MQYRSESDCICQRHVCAHTQLRIERVGCVADADEMLCVPRLHSIVCERPMLEDIKSRQLLHAAMDAEVIAREQRFTLHGLKHRGITDTKGKKADKKEASGHKSEAMLDRYDHEVAIVEPARPGEVGGVS
nr:hypothetical protein [Steroidobacter cummioxidans]